MAFAKVINLNLLKKVEGEKIVDTHTGSAIYSRPIENIKLHRMCAHWHKKKLSEIFLWM